MNSTSTSGYFSINAFVTEENWGVASLSQTDTVSFCFSPEAAAVVSLLSAASLPAASLPAAVVSGAADPLSDEPPPQPAVMVAAIAVTSANATVFFNLIIKPSFKICSFKF